MSEYINIIWEIIELLAAVVECIIITFFVTGMLGFRNTHLKNIKTIGFITVSCINSIFISAYIGVDSVSAVNQILICAVFSLLFLRGSFLYKIFVSALSMFIILMINSITLTLMSNFFKTPIYILISTSSILRLTVLLLTKLIYFAVTRILIRFSKSFKFHISKAESIYVISVFLMTLIAGNILFEITASAKFPVQFGAIVFLALIFINILNFWIVRKIYKRSINAERINQEIIKQNEKIKALYQEISSEYNSDNLPCSDILSCIILNAQIKCRKKNIIFNYSISPYIHEFPENVISGVVYSLLNESIAVYNRWEYKPNIDLEILSKDKYMSIIISHYIRGTDVEMLMEDRESEMVPFNPYRNKIISCVLAKYNGFVFRSQKRDKIITNVWLDFSGIN